MRHVTRYRRSDAPAAVEFFREVNALDETIAADTLPGWQAFVDEPENDGGSGFFTVWGDDERLIALAYSHLEAAPIQHFRIFVHPLHRRRGLARILLAAIAEQHPRHLLQTNCPERWRAMAAFLRATGFEAIDREDQLRRPSGVLRHRTQRVATARAEPSDLAAICRIHELAYRGSVGFVPLYPATLEQRVARAESELWVTRAPSDGVTAFIELNPGAEWEVNSVATSPAFQRQGLATALLELASERASAEGRGLRLFVRSTNANALRLYQRLGFVPVSFSTRYVRGSEPFMPARTTP
ncbi:MAG: GNAT family N-acetyltransferase [Proteobacteria bacterium]|nr:GNAT family N-acetyltransferase [Pseudomonadota bacterium]